MLDMVSDDFLFSPRSSTPPAVKTRAGAPLHKCWGMAFGEVCGTLLRAGASAASGGFGHVGHGGHDGGIGSERRLTGSFVGGPQADVCLASERWPVGSHFCDPGMKRDLILWWLLQARFQY